MRFIQRWISIITFYFSAQTIHNVHPPYAFELLQKTLEDERDFYALGELAYIKHILLADQRIVRNNKTIAELSKTQSASTGDCTFMFKLTLFLKPKKVLVFAKPLNILALYIAKADTSAEVDVYIENQKTAQLIQSLCMDVNINNVNPISVNPSDLLSNKAGYDLIYFDKEYAQKKEIDEEQILSLMGVNNSALISTSSTYSPIKHHNLLKTKAPLTVDLYNMSVMIKNNKLVLDQHYRIVKKKYKPWRIGLW